MEELSKEEGTQELSLTAASGEGGVLEIKAKMEPAIRGSTRESLVREPKGPRDSQKSDTDTGSCLQGTPRAWLIYGVLFCDQQRNVFVETESETREKTVV